MEKKRRKIKQSILSKFISGSLMHGISEQLQQTRKPLNQVQGLLNRTLAQGFTLIELLVVIIIIAILAAIAVPQYQKAVQKTKYARLMATLVPMAKEVERYYTEHGTYATSFDQLDIALPSSTAKTCSTNFSYAVQYVNDVCVELLKDPVYGIRVSPYPGGGRYSNGYVYAVKTTYWAMNLPKGFYCFQNLNATNRDGFCKGAIKSDNAYGVYHAIK